MSKIKLTGNASGTGVLTVTAPNTSTDRTITLPDATGTLLNSDGDGSSLTGVADATKLPLAGGTLTGNVTVSASGADASRTLSLQGTNGSSEVYQFNLIADGGNSAAKFMIGSGGGAASEKLRIQSGGGISFNGDSAASNALDDYEEGTHTVTATCSGGGSITLSSTNNKFTYTKIGNLVTITGRLDVSAISSPSGDLSFSLPFTVAQTGSSQNQSTAGAMFVWYPTSGDSGKWVAWADGGESAVYVRHGDGVQPPQSANLARVSTEFRLNFSYTTA